MSHYFNLFVTLLLSGLLIGSECHAESHSISELEQQIENIDSKLGQLASYSLRSGVGAVGYRSQTHKSAHQSEWIQIELGETTPIDQIVLVPTIWRDTKTGLRADGFPKAFRIIAGITGDTEGAVIALYQESDKLLPRIAPLVMSIPETRASWLRLETIRLSPRIWNGDYVLQLSEIMVFSGEENVALHKAVETSSLKQALGEARDKRFLVDGFVPYLMDAADGKQSAGYMSGLGIHEHPSFSIDLGQVLPINRIHLHSADLSDTIPQAVLDGFGIPNKLLVEGANLADFSDAVRLFEYQKNSVYDTGPILTKRFSETSCRYVRLTATEAFIDQESHAQGSDRRIGFSEIEIFSRGQNVALDKAFESNFMSRNSERSLVTLSDGNNFYGSILPTRGWMSELAQRHALETQRPILVAALQQAYKQQKAQLRRMGWLAALLLVGIGFSILINSLISQRNIFKTRERIAANLHDELGANLHAIGMLGELAKDEVDATGTRQELAELIEIVDEIRSVSTKTSTAARYCTNILETPGLYENLIEEMTRTSKLMLADIEHDIAFEGEAILSHLKRRARIDLYLFYKECLTNIIRHSGATEVTTRLTATKKLIHLSVIDNGRGLGDFKELPISLKRRARLLGGQLSIKSNAAGGTTIELNYRLRRLRFGK